MDADAARYKLAKNISKYGTRETPDGPDHIGDAARAVPAIIDADDPGLRDFAVTVAATNPAAAAVMNESARRMQSSLAQVQILDNRGDTFRAQQAVEKAVSEAVTGVQNDIADLTGQFKKFGEGDPASIAMELRGNIVALRVQTQDQVKQAFDAVDPDNKIRMLAGPTIKKARELMTSQPLAVKLSGTENRLYQIGAKFFRPVMPFNELTAYRSEINGAIQQSNNLNEKRRLRELLDVVDENIDMIATGNRGTTDTAPLTAVKPGRPPKQPARNYPRSGQITDTSVNMKEFEDVGVDIARRIIIKHGAVEGRLTPSGQKLYSSRFNFARREIERLSKKFGWTEEDKLIIEVGMGNELKKLQNSFGSDHKTGAKLTRRAEIVDVTPWLNSKYTNEIGPFEKIRSQRADESITFTTSRIPTRFKRKIFVCQRIPPAIFPHIPVGPNRQHAERRCSGRYRGRGSSGVGHIAAHVAFGPRFKRRRIPFAVGVGGSRFRKRYNQTW